MIAKQYITSTGVYWNRDEYQHEAWVVNQDTGEKTCIGWMRDDGLTSEMKKQRRRWWENKVWARWLGLGHNAALTGERSEAE